MISTEEQCCPGVIILTSEIFQHTCYCLRKCESALAMDLSEEKNLDQCNEAQGHGQGGVTLVSLPQHLLSPPGDAGSCSSPLGFIRPIVLLQGVVLTTWRNTACAPDRLELHFAGPVSGISQVSFTTLDLFSFLLIHIFILLYFLYI